MSRPLSSKQLRLVERLRGGRLLIAYIRPGTDDCLWYIEKPYSDEDGRTCLSLLARGLLKSEGDGLYILREREESWLDRAEELYLPDQPLESIKQWFDEIGQASRLVIFHKWPSIWAPEDNFGDDNIKVRILHTLSPDQIIELKLRFG